MPGSASSRARSVCRLGSRFGLVAMSLWLISSSRCPKRRASVSSLNLEESQLFNSILGDFLASAEAARWGRRDSRSLSTSTTGMAE